ncbi:MAG: right-handed parallel beta-helix repeat-containing protein [Victivallales bacterium]|nr:right-handed parallel beta-helix repeat-containing protein [Victivallales bacterium]
MIKSTNAIRMKWFMICLLVTIALSGQNATDWAREWRLDGSLEEAHGLCPLREGKQPPEFVMVDGRKMLKMTSLGSYTSNDDPLYRLEPGFRFACRVKFDSLDVGNGWATIASKGHVNSMGSFTFRIDKPEENRRFSFFINIDGRPEPRVSSREPVKTGVWYDLEAGWDGNEIWLSVNGDVTRRERKGPVASNFAPLQIGPIEGLLSDFRITGRPNDSHVVGKWDHVIGKQEVANTKKLQLSPCFRLQCEIVFDEMPQGETYLIQKEKEYLLRYDMGKDGTGAFNFFSHLNGHWEPRVTCPMPLEIGKRYSIVAAWDGMFNYLHVNGKAIDKARIGIAAPTENPLVLGGFKGKMDHLVIENPQLPMPLLRDMRCTELLPMAGQEFGYQAWLDNAGSDLEDCIVVVEPSKGLVATPSRMAIGRLPSGSSRKLEWRLKAAESVCGNITISLYSNDKLLRKYPRRVVVLPKEVPDYSAKKFQPETLGGTWYFIDSVKGDDSRDGHSEKTAWRSFKNINGKTLQAGERLRLKRGSVFREELQISAKGTADNWAVIDSYGEGCRPIIRRNRDIDDRCMYVLNPDYLVIRDLIVCNAGKGIDVSYQQSGHRGILIERCLAHHIEGLYRFNAHGIPEWRDKKGAPGSGNAGGISVGGYSMSDVILRDCEMYQCSVAFRTTGDNVFMDRIFCHDNYAHNTSPHPVVSMTTRSILQNSVFDSSGWNASAGTMGIMLGPNYGFIVRNCYFINQPDSNSSDEGGIDFEADGENNLIDHCTFRNNAGAAIEVLGLRTPQTRNVAIRNCRFDKNNTATKLGPSEIFVWGGTTDRSIVCSNGVIENNGYVLRDGIEFYVNKATSTIPDWKLANNTQYATSEELNKAMPYTEPPERYIGYEFWTDKRDFYDIWAECDTLKFGASVKSYYENPENTEVRNWIQSFVQIEGPANMSSTGKLRVGDYRFQFVLDNEVFWTTTRFAVHVLPKGTSVKKAWCFDKNLDKEGWTDADLGTVKEYFKADKPEWGTFANPVNLVCGDYYVMAVKDAKNAHILSAEGLGLKCDECPVLTIRMQNHTNSKRMKVSFTTDAMTDWSSEDAVEFDVVPNDNDDTLYQIRLDVCAGWKGTVRQLRIDFSADETPITGTVRIDYIWLGSTPK